MADVGRGIALLDEQVTQRLVDEKMKSSYQAEVDKAGSVGVGGIPGECEGDQRLRSPRSCSATEVYEASLELISRAVDELRAMVDEDHSATLRT